MGFSKRSPDTMKFNAMTKWWWTGRLSAVRLTFRRLPSVASGRHYENLLTPAGYTLAIPCFGLKNGVHFSRFVRMPGASLQALPGTGDRARPPSCWKGWLSLLLVRCSQRVLQLRAE